MAERHAMGCNSWIIFDADNTLWAIEHFYNESRDRMCDYLSSMGLDPSIAKEFQLTRDAELHATYGYSACRFARSFEDTLLHFIPGADAASIRHVRGIALEVFERTAVPVDGLEALLDRLSAAQYTLGVITAGERWVQERRLSDFHLRHRFAVIEIVESKNESVFRGFVQRNHVDASTSWVVGDSLASDVIPARKAGMCAVLVDSTNWAHIEGHSDQVPDDVPVIESLTDLLSVVGPR